MEHLGTDEAWSAGHLCPAPGSGTRVPSDIRGRYLELPPGFPRRVVSQARQVTARRTTPYDKALALQDWFRTNFQYSLSAPSDLALARLMWVRLRTTTLEVAPPCMTA